MAKRVQDNRQPPVDEPAGADDAPSGHARALSQLFEHHNHTLVSFLVSRLGSEAEAREVAQEAYVRMLQIDRPGAVSFLRAYLFCTAANIAIDRIRRRVRAQRMDQVYEDEELTDSISPDREVIAREQLGIVRRALLELPVRYRRAFLMHRFEDMSTEDIGAALGLKETQIRKYLRRAVAYCRLRMDGASAAEAKDSVFP